MEVIVWLHSFFNLGDRWGEGIWWSTPRHSRFNLRGEDTVPNYSEFGGLHGLSGRIWKMTSPEFEPQTDQGVTSRHTGRSLLYTPSFDSQRQRLLFTPRTYEICVVLGTNNGYLYGTNLLTLTARYDEFPNIIRVKLSFQGVKMEVMLNCKFVKPVLYWRNIHTILFSPALFIY